MLQNAYLLAKIGADTAENEQHFTEIFQKLATMVRCLYRYTFLVPVPVYRNTLKMTYRYTGIRHTGIPVRKNEILVLVYNNTKPVDPSQVQPAAEVRGSGNRGAGTQLAAHRNDPMVDNLWPADVV